MPPHRPSPGPTLPEPAAEWALFLDLDGTLVDIAERPDAVAVDAGLPSLLARLARLTGGALAVVSGRGLDDIDRILAPCRLPTAALHGLVRRDAKGAITNSAANGTLVDRARTALASFAANHPGVVLEDKGLAIALHFRQVPHAEAAARATVAAVVAALAGRVHVQEGKMVLEIRATGADKGAAVEAFMAEIPFRGRTPVYIGDDLTDEDGFAAVNRLGGRSIKVGHGASKADWRVPSVAALRDWLEATAREAPADVGRKDMGTA
ncbi:MAG: trehalose-phosphatase [Candidatus Eiseniibacteriota bacterium]